MKTLYKVVSASEWATTYKDSYPDAVRNSANSECMLSCNDGTGELTRKQAQTYIATNWYTESDQPIPGDNAKIKSVQVDNHTQGTCFEPWVESSST